MTNFFGPHSPYLNHPLLTPERTRAEVDDLIPILGLKPGQTVLDIGCGFGRHSLELARRGYRPTGLDPSTTMIDAARGAAAADQLEVDWMVGTGQDGPAGPFDGAIALFTTLGQVGPDGTDNLGLLATTARTLAPGARLVVEVPQRNAAVAGLVTHDQFGDGDNRTEITRRFDPATNRVIEAFEVVTNGVTRTFDLAYRLFSAEELTEHLHAAGFVDVAMAPDLPSLARPETKPATSPTMSADAAMMCAAATTEARHVG